MKILVAILGAVLSADPVFTRVSADDATPIEYDPQVPREWVAQADVDAGTDVPTDVGDGGLATASVDGGVPYCDFDHGVCAVQYCFAGKLMLPEGWWLSNQKVTTVGTTIVDLKNTIKEKDAQIAAAQGSTPILSGGFWNDAKWFVWGFGVGGGVTALTTLYIALKAKK